MTKSAIELKRIEADKDIARKDRESRERIAREDRDVKRADVVVKGMPKFKLNDASWYKLLEGTEKATGPIPSYYPTGTVANTKQLSSATLSLPALIVLPYINTFGKTPVSGSQGYQSYAASSACNMAANELVNSLKAVNSRIGGLETIDVFEAMEHVADLYLETFRLWTALSMVNLDKAKPKLLNVHKIRIQALGYDPQDLINNRKNYEALYVDLKKTLENTYPIPSEWTWFKRQLLLVGGTWQEDDIESSPLYCFNKAFYTVYDMANATLLYAPLYAGVKGDLSNLSSTYNIGEITQIGPGGVLSDYKDVDSIRETFEARFSQILMTTDFADFFGSLKVLIDTKNNYILPNLPDDKFIPEIYSVDEIIDQVRNARFMAMIMPGKVQGPGSTMTFYPELYPSKLEQYGSGSIAYHSPSTTLTLASGVAPISGVTPHFTDVYEHLLDCSHEVVTYDDVIVATRLRPIITDKINQGSDTLYRYHQYVVDSGTEVIISPLVWMSEGDIYGTYAHAFVIAPYYLEDYFVAGAYGINSNVMRYTSIVSCCTALPPIMIGLQSAGFTTGGSMTDNLQTPTDYAYLFNVRKPYQFSDTALSDLHNLAVRSEMAFTLVTKYAFKHK